MSAMPPQQLGEAIDVPFISICRWSIQVGTVEIAPPGAKRSTPKSPSYVGPREVQVYGMSGNLRRMAYSACIMAGEIYAPTPIRAEAVPPGAPTVDRAGPAFPALETKITLCRSTSSESSSRIRPALGRVVGSP